MMHPVDYAFIAVICLASVGIGIVTSCTGGRQKSTKEYVMGNRQMRLLPVAISILVSFWSAVALLGSPAEIFYFGSYYNLTGIGIALACLVSAFTFVPLFYPLQITSIYEYLELRYNNKFIRYWSTFLYVITSVLYLAVAQLAPAIALDAVMNIPQWAGILIIGVISVIYTALGGIKAVIWSDVFQSFFILVGLLAVVIKASIDSGGLQNVMDVSSQWGRLETFDWRADPRVRLTVWSSTIGVMFGWIPWYGPNQAAFQRFASLPTLAKAKWSILLNVLGVILLFSLLALTGYALFAFYAVRGCDPFSNSDIQSINQLLPIYVKTELQIPSFGGILIACVLSGAFSTTSTVLNSQAAVTVIDFVQPYRNLSDAKATVLIKWLVVAYGVLGAGIAFASSFISGVSLAQISASLLNASTGATLGVYLLAACVPKSTWQGAFVGSLASLILVGWLCIGALAGGGGGPAMLPLPDSNCTGLTGANATATWPTSPASSSVYLTSTLSDRVDELPVGLDGFYSISFQWYGLLGAGSCLLVGLLVSLPSLLDANSPEPDEIYIMPGLRGLLRRLKSPAYNKVQAAQKTQLEAPGFPMETATAIWATAKDGRQMKTLATRRRRRLRLAYRKIL
ncbi:hypothetical protein BOX15_Mlig024453g1 [Macrostomum lignano]|uniref:Sodium-coupled monocarboxylate transporter 1 n=1 Tax=Macrostomum lignano TaxID=282301 RepID=A0A267FNZ0_9PLAT|nr:hypothetical protein BOX15_Mlig024453g1 [Macrostomum lignano]